MNKLTSLFFIIFSMLSTSNAAINVDYRKGEPVQEIESAKTIEVYYFHYSRRCATCNAVEDETKNALEEYFKKQVDDGEITFLSVNVEEDSSATLVDIYQVSGQSLLFVCGDETVDLTDKAFMNARTKPEKFRELVKETVSELMD